MSSAVIVRAAAKRTSGLLSCWVHRGAHIPRLKHSTSTTPCSEIGDTPLTLPIISKDYSILRVYIQGTPLLGEIPIYRKDPSEILNQAQHEIAHALRRDVVKGHSPCTTFHRAVLCCADLQRPSGACHTSSNISVALTEAPSTFDVYMCLVKFNHMQ